MPKPEVDKEDTLYFFKARNEGGGSTDAKSGYNEASDVKEYAKDHQEHENHQQRWSLCGSNQTKPEVDPEDTLHGVPSLRQESRTEEDPQPKPEIKQASTSKKSTPKTTKNVQKMKKSNTIKNSTIQKKNVDNSGVYVEANKNGV
ncbi:unnamed protein product [Bursaphelenchus okinawaensis]|uniref:Uncharacterized protein n=1 Tax=Bursaphelenchus okinawaensis TaxID=465554 RepID=A0A811LV85_9BILA|nr:unnamed protein product [Bursaphelenchus okinawaensis]CAG9127858.1 unnamed protein product [Bursaphelenchus okinawaensis]